MRIGIDVGGTFTDFLLTHDDGTSQVYKVLSTPDDPSVATLLGIEEMASDRGLPPGAFLRQVEVIVHGTTVTTNAVLTRSGAKTGLLTTAGVRDALEMRRGIREEQYNNRFENVRPLAERYLRRPVRERLDWAGAVVTPLATADVEDACELFAREGVEAVAVCFMNSFASGAHEQAAAAIVRERLPGLYLTVSNEFLPSIRFYDRLSTTVLNSYVGPILKRYLDALLLRLEALAYEGILLIMASNGGVVSPEAAKDNAAITLLSGPAGGPVAGVWYTSEQGYDDCITADMGGTSFDAALVKARTPLVTTVGEIDRLRIALPMLNVVTIGAGGGSIGWINEGGLLRMGPQSAGAKPGPVCYGLGGDQPTCTDADLVLGYLDPGFFAGGRIRLDAEAAARAIEERIARPLGLPLHAAAAGMYDLINTNMAAAVREVAVKQGQDPRDFPLVIAGGAGPNHACRIALELEIPMIIVPRESSIFCAAGMLMSDIKHSFVKTYATPLEQAEPGRFKVLFEEMRRAGERMLAAEGFDSGRARLVHSLDLRYVNQYHEVEVEIPAAAVEACDFDAMAKLFHPVHNKLFGYSLEDEGAPVELINMRLVTIGITEKPRFQPMQPAGDDPARAFKRQRRVYLPRRGDFAEIPVYDGFSLAYGNRIEGPAIIEQVNTTTFVTPEYRVLVDRYGNYTMYLPEREGEATRRAER